MDNRIKAKDLYGPDVQQKTWANMNYKEVIEQKLRLARANIKRLANDGLDDWNMKLIKQSMDAMKFNENLLKEMKEW